MRTHENYKRLCVAIVIEQCIEYDEAYRGYLKSPYRHNWRKRRLKELRADIINGFAQYLDVDMETVIRTIERKAEKGEQIIWKKKVILSQDS